MHRKRARRIWIFFFFKKSVSWELDSEREGRLSGLAEAREIYALRAPHVMVGGEQMEKSS